MKTIAVLFIATSIMVAGCARTVMVPPATERLDPAYFPVGAESDAAWDAVIDVLADFGVDFDFISPEMRFAKISGRLASGPIVIVKEPGGFLRGSTTDTIPNPQAIEWADCGTIDGDQTVGWGDLFAKFSIRVREHQNQGIVKVVIPEMWQEMRLGLTVETRRLDCVSKGTFEDLILDRIQDRVVPRMGTRIRVRER